MRQAQEDIWTLEQVLEALGAGVLVLGSRGKVVASNESARHLLGVDFHTALTESHVSALLNEVRRTGASREDSLELYGPPQRTLRLRVVPLHDGAVVELTDVSEASRVDRMRRDFVANVSHELKTPLGALALLAETLTGEEEPVVRVRLAERIREEAERLVHIVEDLLDLSRLERGDEAPRAPVSLPDALGEAVTRAEALAAQKRVRVELAEPEPGAVLGDQDQLVSAIFNLLANAITYSDPGSVVRAGVDTTAEGGHELWVADEGIGIDPGEKERIFERFYRVDRARSRVTGGTGLGLAIVRHVAHNHDAHVEVESELGKGSRFALVFPPPATEAGL
jgi:two-component system, OmpR family, sensor histidine kinase SenX3